MGVEYDPPIHHRRSIRWTGYDYSQPGFYFFTICTADKLPLFGRLFEGQMILNEPGEIVEAAWRRLPQRFPGTELDSFVVMPNHVHGIIQIRETGTNATNRGAASKGAASSAPTVGDPGQRGATLGEILRAFKSISARGVNQQFGHAGSVWQRNYYERVLRADEIDKVREYITTNPLRRVVDSENPDP